MDTDLEVKMRRGLGIIDEIKAICGQVDSLLAAAEEKSRAAKVIFGAAGFNQKKVNAMMPVLPRRVKSDTPPAPQQEGEPAGSGQPAGSGASTESGDPQTGHAAA